MICIDNSEWMRNGDYSPLLSPTSHLRPMDTSLFFTITAESSYVVVVSAGLLVFLEQLVPFFLLRKMLELILSSSPSLSNNQINKVRIARIFNTYGPPMCIDDGRVVSNFVAQALRKEPLTVYGDGKQKTRGEHVGPFNLGNLGEFTMLELAQACRCDE
ncbi:hypothetical protein ACFE04_004480 [Oxalis oulophora]